MKVLFLDIDGVLNKNNTETYFIDDTRNYLKGLDRQLVQRYLRWRASQTIPITVLASSWKSDNNAKKLLRENGIYWSSTTNPMGDPCSPIYRGQEIARWLALNPKVTHVAILDDYWNMKPVGKYLVQTSNCIGLQDKHLHRINGLLDL